MLRRGLFRPCVRFRRRLEDRPRALIESDSGMPSAQHRRRPPVPFAEQRHQGGHERRADDERVDEHRDHRAEPDLLEEDDLGGWVLTSTTGVPK
jgi:hypothetical protein